MDGHNRKEICERIGRVYETVEISLASKLDAMIWIRRNQVARRNLTDDQRAMNAAALAELESKKAMRDRASKGTPAREAKRSGTLQANVTRKVESKEWTRPSAAASAHVSEHKVRQAQAVRKASSALASRVEAGDIPLAQAVREIKREAIVQKLENVEAKAVKAIQGVYDVLVIDPPWPMEKIERDVRPNQSAFDYPTMSEEQIAEVKLPTAAVGFIAWLDKQHPRQTQIDADLLGSPNNASTT